MQTVAEIGAALDMLTPGQLREVARMLGDRLSDENPDMLAMLDAGDRSLRTEPTVPAEMVRRKVRKWTTRSFSPHKPSRISNS